VTATSHAVTASSHAVTASSHARAAARLSAFALILSLAACASSFELIGKARPPLKPEQVQLYLEPPNRQYEQIAIIKTSSTRSFAFTSQGKAEVVVKRLKIQAAKLGANGVLLKQITDESDTSVGAGAGTSNEGPRGTLDVGVTASALLMKRYGHAIAIYLPPG
jgi:hypothetical protein